jgi:hypothetical protein
VCLAGLCNLVPANVVAMSGGALILTTLALLRAISALAGLAGHQSTLRFGGHCMKETIGSKSL